MYGNHNMSPISDSWHNDAVVNNSPMIYTINSCHS